jgi:hypothetical protein
MSLWLCALNPESQWEYKLENTKKNGRKIIHYTDQINAIISSQQKEMH